MKLVKKVTVKNQVKNWKTNCLSILFFDKIENAMQGIDHVSAYMCNAEQLVLSDKTKTQVTNDYSFSRIYNVAESSKISENNCLLFAEILRTIGKYYNCNHVTFLNFKKGDKRMVIVCEHEKAKQTIHTRIENDWLPCIHTGYLNRIEILLPVK
jgi:hypothetical protein